MTTIRIYAVFVFFWFLGASFSGYAGVYHGVEFSADAFSLITAGSYQEALWNSAESGNEAGVELLRTQIESALRSEPLKIEKMVLGGKTEKEVLAFEGGVKGLFKPTGGRAFKGDAFFSCAGCEVAAYEFDKLFNLNVVPVTVPRYATLAAGEEPHWGSIQYLVQQELKAGIGVEAPTFPKMVFLDYVSGNSDRHPGNWLYWESAHRVIAIDHGLAFRTYDHAYEEFDHPAGGHQKVGAKSRHLVGIYKIRKDPVTGEFKKGLELSAFFHRLDPELRARIVSFSPARLREEMEFMTTYGGNLEALVQRFHNVQLILEGKADDVTRVCKTKVVD